MNRIIAFSVFCTLLFIIACFTEQSSGELPIIGHREIVNKDTIYHTIPDFIMMNQDSMIVTNSTFENKIYVADFFFTFCTVICPKVKANMLRIYEEFEDDDRLVLISHTVAPKYDTIPALKRYADKINIDSKKWHLVRGEKETTYQLADDYFIVAKEDPTAPGGYDHSGKIMLIDTKRQVRSFAEGTEDKEVDRLIKDIYKLLNSEFGKGH